MTTARWILALAIPFAAVMMLVALIIGMEPGPAQLASALAVIAIGAIATGKVVKRRKRGS